VLNTADGTLGQLAVLHVLSHDCTNGSLLVQLSEIQVGQVELAVHKCSGKLNLDMQLWVESFFLPIRMWVYIPPTPEYKQYFCKLSHHEALTNRISLKYCMEHHLSISAARSNQSESPC
jgi:hypothetical protein